MRFVSSFDELSLQASTSQIPICKIFDKVLPIVFAFVASTSCKAVANDAYGAVLLVYQKVPALSSFCFLKKTVLIQNKIGFCLSCLDCHLLSVVLKSQICGRLLFEKVFLRRTLGGI